MERTPRSVTLIGAEQTVLSVLGTPSPRLTPTGKISHAKTRVYTQRYRKEWEQMQDFSGWLTSVPYQPTRAYCKYCKKNLHAHRLSLLKHTCTMKHQRAALTHELEEKKRKLDPNSTEIGLIEEVETMDDQQIEVGDENEEIEYVVERLETDEEDGMESQIVKEENIEIIDEEEEEKDVDSLCAQLQSDDDSSKPVIKKIKLMPEQKCRDTLAEAMAHVHSEYLEEEEESGIVDQENVQMEMVVESANTDILSDPLDSTKISEELPENETTETESDKKTTGRILQESNKADIVVTTSLPILNTTYHERLQTLSSTSTPKTLNFMPIIPDMKPAHKTITLMCGSKTFKLTGGTFQPGTQYVLTKLTGKPATLMMADQKKTIVVNEPEKVKVAESAVPSTSQPSVAPSTSQPAAVTVEQPIVGTKGPSSKKVYLGKQTMKPASKKLRISTHVTDIIKGVPIGGLQVSLYKLMDGKWTFLNESNTNSEGHCIDLVEKVNCTAGRYKIHYDVDKYFILRRIETIFPFVEIVFDVKNANDHYHMSLLLGPFGYTIYRGS